MKVKVFKVRDTAKLPVRAHSTDAGMDLFFSPEVVKPVVIEPGESFLLQTGLKIQVPEDKMLQIMNKSGIASKRSLVTGACVVDSGYNGEIFVNLHNIGPSLQMIEPGHKIAQAVFVGISRPEIVVTEEDNIYDKETSRGSGALGSTGLI